MTSEVTTEMRNQFMEDKHHYDSLSQAIKLAKTNGCSDKQIKPLVLEKQKYKKVQASNMDKLMRSMPLISNVTRIQDSWYAVRYVNEKADTCLKIDTLKHDSVSLIQRDGRHERELNRNEIEMLLPGLIDDEAMELYKHQIASKAVKMLAYIGVHVDEVVSDEPIKAVDEPLLVSVHAGQRWVQRVIGIKDEVQAEEYRRLNIQQVNEAVLNGFAKAELVWEEPEDGITYWFDEDNMMYLKGKQDGLIKIITCYEEDFGFTKAINRMIVKEQLAVLSGAREVMSEAVVSVDAISSSTECEVQAINDQIAILESQIALLVSDKTSKVALRDKVNKEYRLAKDKYVSEFNKLFKKRDV